MKDLPNLSRLFDLRGQSALVSGATGALGQVASYVLAMAGAHVTIAGRNENRLKIAKLELESRGGRASAIALRPEDEDMATQMVQYAAERGRGLDIVVAAGGTNLAGAITKMDLDNFDSLIDSNVRQTWLLCRAAGRVMLPQGRGGKIVLLSSTRGQVGAAGASAFSSSKAAIDLMTKSLACEWGPLGINVNAVAPSVVRSDSTRWLYEDDGEGAETRKKALQRIPLRRLGEPEDFAGALLFLCAPASDYMTGQVMYVDGGYTAG